MQKKTIKHFTMDDCIFSKDCSNKHVCGASSCNKKCKSCSKAKKYCPDYSQAFCDTRLAHPLKLCNSCHKRPYCHFESAYYSASNAHQQYRDTLVNSRNGFDLTSEQLIQINDVVSPLVRRGQSIYHIVKTNQHSLPVSKSSIRRLIQSSELDIRPIDLPEAVKRKPRRKPVTHSLPPISKTGHLYQDFLAFIQSHDLPIVQMDCVEGCKTDSGAVLTLHFIAFHMQLYFALEMHDSNSGVDMIIQVFFSTHLCRFVFIFSEFYLVFFSYQIIRAKIEPAETIFLALISPILITHPVV